MEAGGSLAARSCGWERAAFLGIRPYGALLGTLEVKPDV